MMEQDLHHFLGRITRALESIAESQATLAEAQGGPWEANITPTLGKFVEAYREEPPTFREGQRVRLREGWTGPITNAQYLDADRVLQPGVTCSVLNGGVDLDGDVTLTQPEGQYPRTVWAKPEALEVVE